MGAVTSYCTERETVSQEMFFTCSHLKNHEVPSALVPL